MGSFEVIGAAGIKGSFPTNYVVSPTEDVKIDFGLLEIGIPNRGLHHKLKPRMYLQCWYSGTMM